MIEVGAAQLRMSFGRCWPFGFSLCSPGAKENMTKNQYSHKQPEKRARVRLQDTFRDHTVDHLCALGAFLGKAVEKENVRIEKAAVCATKVKAFPVSAAFRSYVASSAAASKASSWLGPTKKAVKKLETKLRRAGCDHRMG